MTENGADNATNGSARRRAGESASAPKDSKWTASNIRAVTRKVISNITVEPIMLFYIIPNFLSSLATSNLNLEKACRVNLNYTTETCDRYTDRNFTAEEFAEVSSVVAAMQVWTTPIQSSIPIILVLFVGSWSDRRRRRKPFMLTPLIGELLTAVGLFLCSVYFLEWPLEVAGVVEAIFPALSGGVTILFLSVYSFVADVTSVESRTFRIGLVNTVVSCGFPIASAVSGFLLEALGLRGSYVLIAVAYVLGLLYGWFMIREPRTPVPRPPGTTFVADFFNWRHVWETIKIGLRKRPRSGRLCLLILMAVFACAQGPIHGESSVGFLYVTQKFQWGNEEFGLYGTYSILIGALGNIVVAALLSGLLKLDDCIIGMIAMAIKVIAAPFYAFSTTTWHMYLATATDILAKGDLIAMRAIATKLVEENELGKVMALLGVAEAIIPLIFKPLYSNVYQYTAKDFSGTFFFISMVMSIIGFCLFLWLFILQKRNKPKEDGERKKHDTQDGVANTAFQGDQPANGSEAIEMQKPSGARNEGDNSYL